VPAKAPSLLKSNKDDLGKPAEVVNTASWKGLEDFGDEKKAESSDPQWQQDQQRLIQKRKQEEELARARREEVARHFDEQRRRELEVKEKHETEKLMKEEDDRKREEADINRRIEEDRSRMMQNQTTSPSFYEQDDTLRRLERSMRPYQ